MDPLANGIAGSRRARWPLSAEVGYRQSFPRDDATKEALLTAPSRQHAARIAVHGLVWHVDPKRPATQSTDRSVPLLCCGLAMVGLAASEHQHFLAAADVRDETPRQRSAFVFACFGAGTPDVYQFGDESARRLRRCPTRSPAVYQRCHVASGLCIRRVRLGGDRPYRPRLGIFNPRTQDAARNSDIPQ